MKIRNILLILTLIVILTPKFLILVTILRGVLLLLNSLCSDIKKNFRVMYYELLKDAFVSM
jgi:hypothetical protein